MKKVLIPVVAILFLLTGCFFPSATDIIPPEQEPPTLQEEPSVSNELPVAYIDAITPPTITVGEDATLQGHGIDTDGTIVAYRWRSNIDGPLGVNASIVTNERRLVGRSIRNRIGYPRSYCSSGDRLI